MRFVKEALFLLVIFLLACNPVRHLPDNQRLYKGEEIDFKNSGFFENFGLKGNLDDVIRPEPNSRIFGLIPFRLWIYNLAGDSVPSKGIRHWLKEKVGEPPVVYNDAFAERSRLNAQNYLFNHGYFDSDVNVDVLEKNRKVKLLFNIGLNEQYHIASYRFPEITDSLTFYINQTNEESLIKAGNPYNIDKFTDERTRISDYLKNNGYYAFSPNFLLFQIDSNRNEKEIQVRLQVKEDTPGLAKSIFKMNTIFIYPDFTLGKDTFGCDSSVYSTPVLKRRIARRVEKSYVFITCNKNIKPSVISDAVLFEKGKVYRQSDYTSTINKLMGLGVFKYANIELQKTREDSTLLNADIYLTQIIPRSFRAEVQAVSKSNGFVGPGLNLSYSDKNFFGGAESFTFSFLSGFETQFTKGNNLFSYEIRLQSGLMIPKLIFPFFPVNDLLAKRFSAHTQIQAEFGYSDRVNYFTNRTINLSYAYSWRETPSRSHVFTPVSMDYSNLGKVTPLFDSIFRADELIRQSFQDRFIFSIMYDFTLNDQLTQKDRKMNNFLNTNIEFAGNTISLFNRITTGQSPDAANPSTFLGTIYSQYFRTYGDYRIYFSTGGKNLLVTRLFAGLGIPYGNSEVIPFSKQFFSGGANSLRGFQYRGVGPGSYSNDTVDRSFIDQTGDIKLEGNIEFRFLITDLFRGAVFADAGNVWLANSTRSKPGGEFQFNRFLSELAVNAGIGLRLDVSFFVLRFDVAFPLRIPYLPENERWVIDKIDFTSKEWLSNNIVFNIAIGYPF